MSKPFTLYSFISAERNAQIQTAQRIERRDGFTFKAELKVDRSYLNQSSARLSRLVNGEFVTLLHQVGAEVEVAAKLHALPMPVQGDLAREGKVEHMYIAEIEKLMKLGVEIARG
jgi:hypothetical protein